MSLDVIKEDCPCTNECVRHGKCEECKENHSHKTYPPACER